ncbi:MAG: flavodoxin family protein [Firmicutes bacterium]|nr:flavodoxin family protein [Bacillota bacterium]
MKVGVIYGSSRRGGNSELLAEEVVRGIVCQRVFLNDGIDPIMDKRHASESFGPLEMSYAQKLQDLIDLPIWIFASPVYWYGFSAQMKAFIDRWSQVMRLPEWAFQERMAAKKAYLVLAGGDNPQLKAMGLVTQFYWTCDFMGMDFQGYVIGEGNTPGDVLRDQAALERARQINAAIRHIVG